MPSSTWKITCLAPPPLNAEIKCATDPNSSSHPTSSVTASPAIPGSIIEKIPNTMNSTAAAIYHPVIFLATPVGLRKPSAGLAVAMRHLHAIVFSELAAIRDGPVSVGREHRDSISISSRRYQIFSASRPGNHSDLSLAPCASGGALQLLFFSASAALTPGGRDLILLMNAAAFQSFSSESHNPFANIPDRRTPCFATQKICASVYSVPIVGKCGADGNNAPGFSSGFPGVPWHPAHSFKYTFPPAIKFSSVGANGFGTSGASRRTEACTARRITALSSREGGRSPRTSANPRSKYPSPATSSTTTVKTIPSTKFFMSSLVFPGDSFRRAFWTRFLFLRAPRHASFCHSESVTKIESPLAFAALVAWCQHTGVPGFVVRVNLAEKLSALRTIETG